MKTKYVRMHLRGSKTFVDDGTFTQQTIQVPIDADRNVGIVIREVNVELQGATAPFDVASDNARIQLTSKSQSAAVGIDDTSVIAKFDHTVNGAVANGGLVFDMILSKELKPPAPCFSQEIYLGLSVTGAGTTTANYDIIYDIATFDDGEMMSLMKQHLL